MTLILVRHGRTALNAQRRLQGHVDVPLDEVGVSQAKALATRMGSAAATVVTSPLRRARETAEPIAALAGVEPVVDHRWIELDFGELDGLAVTELPVATWDKWRTDPHFAPPGGESLAELSSRVVEACESWAPKAEREDVVVVTHVAPIKAALAWALGTGVEVSIGWRTRIDPASITRIDVGPQGPVLNSFNELAHLMG